MQDTHVEFSIGLITDQKLEIPRKLAIMKVTLTDIQQFNVAITIEDVRGNAATAVAPPVWTASDPALLSVTAAPDGLSAVVQAAGPVGVGQVTVAGDGGPNAGDDPFTGILDVEVVASKATQVVFAPTAPADVPPATP